MRGKPTVAEGMKAALRPYELGTLFGLPRDVKDEAPGAVVLGVPFDTGRNGYRIGSRLGPDHIRSCCPPDRRHLVGAERDVLTDLRVVDWGNVATTPGDIEQTHAAIYAALCDVHDLGAVPVTMGGDGSVSLPQLRAAARRHGELAVVHCDAHTDAYDIAGTGPYTTSTTFLRAQEEGIIRPELTFHIGARGTMSSLDGHPDSVRALGQHVIAMPEVEAIGPVELATRLRSRIGDGPTYLCWDMDVFDPSVAPGVATPEWGGISAGVGIRFLQALLGLNLASIDVNTVSPLHDVQGLTGSLAGRVLLEALSLLHQGHSQQWRLRSDS